MKSYAIHRTLILYCLICITHLANGQNESYLDQRIGRFDTLSLSSYLNLFNVPFPREFNLRNYYTKKDLRNHLSFSVNTQLQNLKIKLPNGEIMSPKIYGWAYSYKRMTNNIYWLTYYFEGQVLAYMVLRVLDIKKKSVSEPYYLSNNGGDEEYWAYTFGRFLDNYTYEFTSVSGLGIMTKDSILGIDRIKLNGDTIQMTRENLIK